MRARPPLDGRRPLSRRARVAGRGRSAGQPQELTCRRPRQGTPRRYLRRAWVNPRTLTALDPRDVSSVPPAHATRDLDTIAGDPPVPVSYTHLTLPTKRIV